MRKKQPRWCINRSMVMYWDSW